MDATTLLLPLLAILCLHAVLATISDLQLTLLAEFVSVDYLWDSSHSRQLYQEDGQFVVANNVIAGVKVSQAGDIYVSVPRWMSGVPSTLNKLVPNPYGPGYVLSPWPSWEFNQINQTGSLQYSQSFLIDSQDRMWVAEVGRTNFYDADPALLTAAPAGLFVLNISDGSVLSTYYFPEEVVSYNNSFVNDLVLDEAAGFVYLSNTWADGGIIVYDIALNSSHMFTAACTSRNASYDFCVNGLCYGTDGIGASPSDGIALSNDGSVLYWSAVQGTGLYSIETKYLRNFSLSNEEFASRAVLLGSKAGCSDGLLVLPSGDLLYGDITHSQVCAIDALGDDVISSSLSGYAGYASGDDPSDLNWIDTFSLDLTCSSCFYFTSNRLNLFFNGTMDFTGQSGANMRVYHAVSSASSSDGSDGLGAAEIAGIVIAVLVGVVGVVYGIRFFLQAKQAMSSTGQPPQPQGTEGITHNAITGSKQV